MPHPLSLPLQFSFSYSLLAVYHNHLPPANIVLSHPVNEPADSFFRLLQCIRNLRDRHSFRELLLDLADQRLLSATLDPLLDPLLDSLLDSLLYSDLNCQNESQNGNIINKTETKTESPGGKAKVEREKEEVEREKGLPADAPLPLDRCRAALEADAPWAARLARLHCRGDTADLLRLMDRFFTRLEAEAVERKSPADARSHFARWLALRAAHDKPLKHMQYGSTKTKKDYART